MIGRIWICAGVLFFLGCQAVDLQTRDDAYSFEVLSPAFAPGRGPNVCIDEAHNNFHTADGGYRPFAEMLRNDGFSVARFDRKFSVENLSNCDLLVIVNPLADENKEDWSYPHPSAFSKDEIIALLKWIRLGGRLALIADHSPFAAAARDLGAVLGIVMFNSVAYGTTDENNYSNIEIDQFTVLDNTLRSHPILRGRSEAERISTVTTFWGQAAQVSQDWAPLLVFGPTATAVLQMDQAFQPDIPRGQWPRFSIDGWIQVAARSLGEGRVVFMGEAAACTAQVQKTPDGEFLMGMNNPLATQNAQFCLNTMRWLAGEFDEQKEAS